MVVDTVSYLNRTLHETNKSVLVEGAQAILLDIDFGNYPMVTSSNCSTGGVCTGLGIPPSSIGEVIGVVKAYLTRYGNGHFPTELHGEFSEYLIKTGHEYEYINQDKHRIGWLDLVSLQYSSMLGGFTSIALTKLDVLDGLSELKIGVAYKKNGIKLDHYPSCQEEMKDIEVEYITLPGWKESINTARKFQDLPANARSYVKKIEEFIKVPVKWIGIGPARDEIIKVY